MYQLGIHLYIAIFRVVSIFNKKARKMVLGHRETWKKLKNEFDPNHEWLWFHAASLGEFEQGRPVMDQIRETYPNYKILLTFYSPSGYEVRKNYAGADLICYLPFDTYLHAKKFIKTVKPKLVFFIKYEFWPNYLRRLRKEEIPTYLISGIFREDQLFFKKWAGYYRDLLETFNHIFVQNKESVELLKSIGRKKDVSISGDTRFDRVLEIKEQAKEYPILDAFKKKALDKVILIAGSTWPKDEELVLAYFNEHEKIQLIIAPHEIHEDHIREIESKISRSSIRLSKANTDTIANYDCIIIDSFGMLSSAYRYGEIAYIGGGFGTGIHNTLEAAVYEIPIMFGPNYSKFQEAKSLLKMGGGVVVESKNDYYAQMDSWLYNENERTLAGKNAGEMVLNGCGGTEKVLLTVPL